VKSQAGFTPPVLAPKGVASWYAAGNVIAPLPSPKIVYYNHKQSVRKDSAIVILLIACEFTTLWT
jgi:hypothetical protein